MKSVALEKNEAPGGDFGCQDGQMVMLNKLISRHPEVGPVIEWLKENGCNPIETAKAVLAKLSQAGKHLPQEQRHLYIQKVLVGEFFARWAKKHQGRTVQQLQEHESTLDAEFRPFQFALIAIGTERAFKRVIRRLAREKMVNRGGFELGNAHDFSCFILDHAAVLAHRFLSNFNPNVFNAASKSVSYVEVTAVSHYLHAGSKVQRNAEGIGQHLKRSTRMKKRTKLAAKLVYLPSLLSKKERAILRKRYGMTGSLVMRMKVKDVAQLLGYPNAAVLSRKFYRLRGWIRKQQDEVKS